jgi:hypothetical protein
MFAGEYHRVQAIGSPGCNENHLPETNRGCLELLASTDQTFDLESIQPQHHLKLPEGGVPGIVEG